MGGFACHRSKAQVVQNLGCANTVGPAQADSTELLALSLQDESKAQQHESWCHAPQSQPYSGFHLTHEQRHQQFSLKQSQKLTRLLFFGLSAKEYQDDERASQIDKSDR